MSQTPINRRPSPLRARRDIVFAEIEFQGALYRTAKDPVGLKYHRLKPEQYRIWELLKEPRSIEEMRDILQQEYPAIPIQVRDVQSLLADLHKKELLYATRAGQGEMLLAAHNKQRWEKIKGVAKNFLFLRLPGWDPERTLTFLLPFVRWMFHPLAVFCCVLFVSSGLALVSIQFQEFQAKLPEFQQFFGWPNLLYMWLTLAGAKILHEFGHGLACKYYGHECHEMGVMLLVFSPCMYCDVSDSWMQQNKWKRIIIGGAGMYVEALLSTVAIFGWWFSTPGLLNHLCLNLFFVSTVSTVIFNLNPLMRFDGYYMLSDYLEIPNLRAKADRALTDAFAKTCLGINRPKDPFMPDRGHFWFGLFAVASWFYRWFLVLNITLFLYTVLKPYGLQSIGITLALCSVVSMVYGVIAKLVSLLKEQRSEPMSKKRISVSLMVFVTAMLLISLIPIPWYVTSHFILEPENVEHVYTMSEGFLKEYHVQPGDDVTKGDLIATLENSQLVDERRQLLTQQKQTNIALVIAKAQHDSTQQLLLGKDLQLVAEQLAANNRLLQELQIIAPCDGKVIAPARVPRPKRSHIQSQLTPWYGTPLSNENIGCLLAPRTPLISIAPNKNYRAILLIDQDHRDDIAVGRDVKLRFYHLPSVTFQCKVAEIAEQQSEFAPAALSNKQGGELPTVADSSGRERLTNISYQATVPIHEHCELLKTGMTGQAQFIIEKRTLLGWFWRSVRRTFHFRM